MDFTHTHYTLSVAIELGHLLLTAARCAPAMCTSRRTVRASWLVSLYKGVAKSILGSVLLCPYRIFICTKILLCIFLSYIGMLDFITECSLHLDK